MHIISLDKKLQTVQFKFTKQQFDELVAQYNANPDDARKEIQRQLYGNLLNMVSKAIPTIVTNNENDISYAVKGYVLSERDMLNVIKEILETDDEVSKQKMLKDINVALGIFA
jgi:hypothetical protein